MKLRKKPTEDDQQTLDFDYLRSSTHLKFNIVSEKLPSEKGRSLPSISFQGLCGELLNFGGVFDPAGELSNPSDFQGFDPHAK